MTLFDLAEIKAELERTDREIEQEDFWNDLEYAQKVMKKKKTMESTIEAVSYTHLVDEARTPLIISGRGDESTDMYQKADSCVRRLKLEEDFTIEEKDKKDVYKRQAYRSSQTII